MLGTRSAKLEGTKEKVLSFPGRENSMGQGPGVGVSVNTPKSSHAAGMAPGLSCINSVHPHDPTLTWVLLFPFYRWRNRVTDRLVTSTRSHSSSVAETKFECSGATLSLIQLIFPKEWKGGWCSWNPESVEESAEREGGEDSSKRPYRRRMCTWSWQQ